MDTMQTRELISAMADGQVQGDAFARGVEVAAGDPAALAAWHTYHLIGDVLRSGGCTTGTLPEVFLEHLQGRLRGEQRPLGAPGAESARVPALAERAAANDATFRWKLVAGFASFAAVAAIGWGVAGALTTPGQPSQMAAAQPGTVLAGTDRGVMIRDPRLDELLAAHLQLGGALALQPAGFLRNATFEGAGR
jgi:sigma-E factor negative regulatory protein RseA